MTLKLQSVWAQSLSALTNHNILLNTMNELRVGSACVLWFGSWGGSMRRLMGRFYEPFCPPGSSIGPPLTNYWPTTVWTLTVYMPMTKPSSQNQKKNYKLSSGSMIIQLRGWDSKCQTRKQKQWLSLLVIIIII